MTLYVIKAVLVVFAIFISLGLIGNFVGIISFVLHKQLRTQQDNFEKGSIWVSFIIGLIMFAIIGMFLATFILSLSEFTSVWVLIPIGLFFVLAIIYYSNKEAKAITMRRINKNASNINHLSIDELRKNTYKKHSSIVNQNVLTGNYSLLPSYIIFLIFSGSADTISFGLNSFLLSLIK